MTKKKLLLSVICVALLGSLVWAGAAADPSDPLVSLRYLTDTFTALLEQEIDQRLDTSDAALRKEVEETGTVTSAASGTWTEYRMNGADALSGVTGTGVLPLAGSVNVYYDSGAVIDVTEGTVIESGGTLTVRHRYLTAEDTSAIFVAVSPTAVIQHQAADGITSEGKTDFNAMADALKTLHMFRGNDIGYAEGFDLESATTRIQALVMFIRVLGEEEAALAWEGEIPFRDVASWAKPYVGYAYEKGYTNGISATQFGSDLTATALHYTEFVLRAMGYSSTATTDLSDTLERAQACGVMTAGEMEYFSNVDPFLRAHLVYISYYALHAQLSDGSMLAETLQSKGVFTKNEWKSAAALVTTQRF